MKIILENSSVLEVEKVKSETEKNAVVYNGFTKDGKQLELYDMDAWKIAPIVKYLITWRKRKNNIFLIILIILSVFFIVWIFAFVFLWSNNTESKQQVSEIEKQQTQEIIKVKKEKQNAVDETTATASGVDDETIDVVYNDSLQITGVEHQQQVLDDMEREIFRLNEECKNEELQKQYDDLQELFAELKGKYDLVTVDNNLLRKRNKELTETIENLPSDDFVYHLGNLIYKTCENDNISEKMYEKCKELYFNFQTTNGKGR